MKSPAILIVEDNPTTRKMFRIALELEGFVVLEAGNGVAALEQMTSGLVQIALLDMALPDSQGPELARRLRALPGGADLRVIAMSGFSSMLENAKQLPEIFDAYLMKPVELKLLIETLRRWIPKPSSPPAARGSAGERHVLVVDDDPLQLKLTRARLAPHVGRVTIAADAVTAVALARSQKPDLILSDILMPGVDGFGLCMLVRQDPVLAAIPVLLMSAHYGGPSDSDLARRVGANAFLRRTPDFEDLVPAVMAALGQDRERPPPILAEPVEQLQREAAGRALHQLDVQLIASILQAQRTARHTAQLSILSGVATTLTRSANVEAELGDVLAACLDAGGFDRGALYRAGSEGALRLSHVVGFPNNRAEIEEVFGQPELLRRAVREAAPLALTAPPLEANDRERFLARAGVRSAMFIPLLGGGQCVGALLLGANEAPSDELAFAHALGAHIGQAIVLAESFARERAARAAAEEASRTKDEFLAMLGHELRNPLAPIVTALELMRLRRNGVFDEERAVIERQVDHLVHLVDDLLDVSRITRGKVTLKRQRMELCEVVARAIEMAGPLLELRHQHLSVSVAGEGLAIDADPTRLAQVVANLLTNAAKYTEKQGRISLVAGCEDEVVVLRVQDSGIGIAPEMLTKVFDPFTQERQALDRSQGGLGLGLAIVRSLVALHGGRVSVHSDGIGRGSEFTIWLPAALGAGGVTHVASLLEKEESPPALAILVVDDNEDAADLLAQYLGELGHRTCIAHDGPAALRAVVEFQPDVALLDIGLPVMDGYELAGRLREQSRPHQVRLVAITGYGQDNDLARSSAAGFDAHLVKPVDLNRLHLVLRGSA